MVVVGMALMFGAYSVGVWGYCLVRGYDVSFRDCFRTRWPGAQVVPSPGHKLGTIPGHVATPNPGQQTGT